MTRLPDCCTPDHGPECWCKQGYAAALDAAKRAVRDECYHDEGEWCIFVAAIDALRGEQ